MTKRELAVRIADETGLTQMETAAVVQKTLDYIIEALEEGQTVEFRNFGVFEVSQRKARVGRNPNQPGSRVQIPERRVVRFKPGRIMKKRITGV